jgi:hypothetical protein
MIDQVIWARAIVPFLVYDWSYILTFVFYFLRLQKDHVEHIFIAVCFFLPLIPQHFDLTLFISS